MKTIKKSVVGATVFLAVALGALGYLINNYPQENKTEQSISNQQIPLKPSVTEPSGEPQQFLPGQDYRVLSNPVTTDAKPENIEVISIFWYGCPHCYALEPKIEQWQKTLPSDVEFTRSPGFFGPDLWQTHARLYYTVANMGLAGKVHAGIFSEIQNRRNPLKDDDQMAEFLNRKFGVEPDAFVKEFRAFGVTNQLRQAFSKLKGYELSGVPAIVIDGRYVVEPGLAGSLNNMPVIGDYLIRKVRQERKD